MTERLEKYESRTTWPLLALALLFLVIYAVPIIWPDLPGWARAATEDLTFAIWLIFAADLAARAFLSGRWFHYLLTHPVDLIVVAVPALRPLRVLRVFATAHVLLSRTGRLSVMRTLPAITIATALLVVIGALAVLDAERAAPNAEITNFGDALWWSMVTVTTVGYGDIVPVTIIGRITTAGLMLVGISLIGAVTASVSAWFMSNAKSAEQENAADNGQRDSDIDARLSALEAQIGDIHGVLVGSDREYSTTSSRR